MTRRSREIEFLILLAYTVLPMYGEANVSPAAVALFQAAVGVTLLTWTRGNGASPPSALMQMFAFAYLLFVPFDLLVISRSVIAVSIHLLFFIAVWQALDLATRRKFTQRVLVLALLFVASMATSTSLVVVPFAVGFFFLLYRQLMGLSREETLRSLEIDETPQPKTRAAALYLVPVAVVALLMFPLLPRLKGAIVRGIVPELANSTTGLSESIDFNQMRSISPDGSAVSRIWMPRQVVPFFTPLRLRGEVYDRWSDGQWKSSRQWNPLPRTGPDGSHRIRRASGLAPEATIEQRLQHDGRLYLPEQTYLIHDAPDLLESGGTDVFRMAGRQQAKALEFRVKLGWQTGPLERQPSPELIDYPITAPVARLAGEIVGDAETTKEKADAISSYLLTNYRYLQNPAELGRPMSVDRFLVQERRGHCEYFAAGMVVLLRAHGIPARIVGGFYGGKLNPLTGYWLIALSDAHAWVEVWDNGQWVLYDPTPPGLRPGTASEGLLRAYLVAIADSVTYFWDRYVLSYGIQDQIDLIIQGIRGLAGAMRSARDAAAAIARQPIRAIPFLLVIALIVVAAKFGRSRFGSATLIGRFAALARRAGLEVGESATPRELLRELESRRPDLAEQARELVMTGERELFAPGGINQDERNRALRQLREMAARV